MLAKDWDAWRTTGDVMVDDSFVRCPNCDELSPLAEWSLGSVYCEDCGDHDAVVCPRCGESHDHVWGPTFEVQSPPA